MSNRNSSAQIGRRMKRLLRKLRRERCQAALITAVADVTYLSGFSGEDSWLVVFADGEAFLVTDGRYTEQARDEAPGCHIVERAEPLAVAAGQVLRRRRPARVAFDPDHLTVRAYRALLDEIGKSELVAVQSLVAEIRQVKDSGEVRLLRRALQIAQNAFIAVSHEVRPGMKEKDVADLLETLVRKHGGQRTAFETIVAAGERSALPHARAGDRAIRAGEVVLVDWGAWYNHYYSDLTRLIMPDTIPKVLREIYEIVLEAQAAALRRIAPGAEASSIDAAGRQVIERAGYGEHFGHGIGHGVGLEVHELPHVNPVSHVKLKPGMVFTVEPAIYLPGRGGVRIEDVVRVTRTGHEVMSDLEKRLV